MAVFVKHSILSSLGTGFVSALVLGVSVTGEPQKKTYVWTMLILACTWMDKTVTSNFTDAFGCNNIRCAREQFVCVCLCVTELQAFILQTQPRCKNKSSAESIWMYQQATSGIFTFCNKINQHFFFSLILIRNINSTVMQNILCKKQ